MSVKEDNEGISSLHHTDLYSSIPPTCLPIVYHPDYNITFMGLEKLHPFDSGKWGKVIRFLKEEQFITDENIVEAREASEEDLLVVHTKRYLSSLKWSFVVATITEIPPLVILPNCLVQQRVLRPLRTQTGGTIMIFVCLQHSTGNKSEDTPLLLAFCLDYQTTQLDQQSRYHPHIH